MMNEHDYPEFPMTDALVRERCGLLTNSEYMAREGIGSPGRRSGRTTEMLILAVIEAANPLTQWVFISAYTPMYEKLLVMQARKMQARCGQPETIRPWSSHSRGFLKGTATAFKVFVDASSADGFR